MYIYIYVCVCVPLYNMTFIVVKTVYKISHSQIKGKPEMLVLLSTNTYNW